MRERTCSVAECDKPHRARGLCATHYNRAHQPDRHAKMMTPCVVCGVLVEKHKTSRRSVCSYRCRYRLTYSRFPEEGKELVGPVQFNPELLRMDTPATALPTLRARFACGVCSWCGAPYVFDLTVTGVASLTCSTRCGKSRSRQRERIARGQFKITQRRRASIYARDNWTCQLCGDPVDERLPTSHPWAATLDHIECQSWTLVPDHSDANLRLAHRMCNSRRGDRLAA